MKIAAKSSFLLLALPFLIGLILMIQMRISLPMFLIAMTIVSVAVYLRHQHRKNAFMFFFTLRRFSKWFIAMSVIGAGVLMTDGGLLGLAAAVPFAVLGYALYRYADHKSRNVGMPADLQKRLDDDGLAVRSEMRSREQIAARSAQAEQEGSDRARAHYEKAMRDIYGDEADAEIRRVDQMLASKKDS